MFTHKEWSENYFDQQYKHENITRGCEISFAELKPCNEIKYERDVSINRPNGNALSLNLYHPVVSSVEVEPSWYKLLLDLLTIQSIFFGVNVFQLLTISKKLPLLLVYLVCLFGFSWHTYHIFDLAISSELTPSQFYEVSERMRMPDVLFCFQMNTSLIDENRKLTGHYLEQLTGDMTPQTIFKHIAYLNESKWISSSQESGFRNIADLHISTFFFLDCKCFNISLNRVYYRNKFHFLLDTNVLRINFSKHLPAAERFFIKGQHIKFFFLTKSRGKMELSKIIQFSMNFNKFQISIDHEVQELRYEDRFNSLKLLLKDPLSLFHEEYDANDVDFSTRRLLSDFKEAHQKVTRNLPIRRSLFNYEIDDRLFEQYFNETQAAPRHANFNYRREFAINHLRINMKIFERHASDFLFRLTFFKKVILATNDENYTKLFLNLLNVLSIWFGIYILNLPTYLFKIKQIFTFIRRSIFKVYKFFSEL